MARSGFVLSLSSLPFHANAIPQSLPRAVSVVVCQKRQNPTRRFPFFTSAFLFLFLTLRMAVAQNGGTEGTGLQPTETTNGEVSVDTLDVNLDIPIVSKSGIGLPLTFGLHFNNNHWIPGAGSQPWYSATFSSATNGWTGLYGGLNLAGQVIGYSGGACYYEGTPYMRIQGYADANGNAHLWGLPVTLGPGGTFGTCSTVSSFTGLFNDGSGITLSLVYGGQDSAIGRDGTVFNVENSEDTSTIKDVNGNTITQTLGINGSGQVVATLTDTFNVVELTLTLPTGNNCGSGTSAYTYTYPTSTGSANVTVSCTSYTIQTYFQCTGILEANTTANLPTTITLPDTSFYTITYESQVAGSVTGRIASITYPNGREVTYSYTGAHNGINCADGSTAGLTRTDSVDGTYTYTRSTNFLTTTLVGPSPANNTTVYTFSQQSAAPKDMFLVQKVTNQGSGTALRTDVYCYNGTETNCTTAAAPGYITQMDVYTTMGSMTTSSRVSTTFDSYMNKTSQAVYGFGASTPTRVAAWSSFGSYWNGSLTSPRCLAIGSGVHNVPCQVSLTDGSGNPLRNSYYVYGSSSNPGSLLSQTVWAGGTTYLTSNNAYNTNGTPQYAKDFNGNQTTFTFSACNGVSNAVLTKVVPPISTLYTQYTWDSGCNGAKMMSATDPNGFPASATYNDPFWRPNSVTDQLLNTVNISYGYSPLTTEAQMTFSAGSSGSSDFDVFNTADGLGRPLYAQQIEAAGGSWDTVQMGYSWNATGRVTTKTMPCATSKGSGCSNGITTTTHDALGRALVATDGGGGTITNTYTGHSSGCGQSLLGCLDILSVVGPAPAGEVVKQIQKEYNGVGQLVSECQLSSATGTTSCGQANGGTGYLTSYYYNADGTVASVVRGSQTHSFTYDALGRTLSATYPESATKNFFYDSAPSTPGVACSGLGLLTNSSPLGNLLKTYDANGTTTCYSYDSMNRVTSVAYSGTNWDGENKYFVYDSATVNGVNMTIALGRVAEAYTAPTASGTKVTDEGFSYTGRGEVSDVYQWSTNSNGYYHTTATYLANGALYTLNGIPGNSGTPWTYGLDGKGRPFSATESSSNNMVSGTTYNSADEPCLITLGLGDTDTYVYDNASCTTPLVTGRMTSYTFSIGSTPTTFTGSLSWNPNGTLRGLTTVDAINSGSETETCSYGTSSSAGYDEFGRLLQVNCVNGSTNVWNQAFSYDMYNNVTKTGSVTWACTACYNSSNNQYNSTLGSVSYDSNGNLLTDTFHTYTWNQDNHPKAMTDVNITLIYDAFGRMVEQKTGSAYQQILISPVGPVALMSKQNLTQYRMPLPGGDVDVTGIYFYHKDNLGSVPLVSSRGGRASIAARLFAPYGESYNNAGITGDISFTGDYQDVVAGTFDTPNRELNPNQGRWISPDPAHSSWNAYAYSTNPMSETDPSGMSTVAQLKRLDLQTTMSWDGYSADGNRNPLNIALPGAGGLGPLDGCGAGCQGDDPFGAAFGDILGNPNFGVSTVNAVTRWALSGDPGPAGDDGIPAMSVLASDVGVYDEDLDAYMFYSDVWDAANNGPSWGATFFSTLGNGLLHGVRQPGQSFSECVNQNITTMTFGTVDPSKLFNQALGQLEGAATFLSIATVPGMGSSGVPIGPLMAGSFAQAMGQTGLSAAAFMRAAAGGMQTLAVAGAATVGAGIGSSINCR
jgi:RHS repeat-associated protein